MAAAGDGTLAGSGQARGRVRICPLGQRPQRYICLVESYAAVVTTGIYCRPDCGARPRSDHVVHFALAASAEAAGYRACLRCRPYRSPQPALTAGPDLVCRGVQLILDGVLDGDTETALSAELGVSSRHLRRLFTDHLGVTPDGLARSARTHFARRLLDDTDLPIADIAFAAGFGSLRQFNRNCLAVFRMTPNQLRARRRRTDRLVADGGLLLRLPYRGRLGWPAVLSLLEQAATPGVESVSDNSYRRTIVVRGHPGALELTEGGAQELLLRLHLPRWEELLHIVGRARRLVRLDANPPDEVPTGAGAQRAAVRPLGGWDPFETGVRALIDRQVPAEVGRGIAGRVVERFGEPVPGLRQLGLTHTFPTPAALAGAPLEDVGLPSSPAAAVRRFAQAVDSGEVRPGHDRPVGWLAAGLSGMDGVPAATARDMASGSA